MHPLLAIPSGGLVGFVLGLIGGGGSIVAVPLLVYWVGEMSAHVALGTSALAVALSALVNLAAHARVTGRVRWGCAAVFTPAGMAGAALGSTAARHVDGQRLLLLFGILMLVVGAAMLRKRSGAGEKEVLLCAATARQLAPRLAAAGLLVGLLSGFFGIGGGFLIVPALLAASGMSLACAIGTSLISVAAFGATTAANYALAGMVDVGLVLRFMAGGVVGGLAGTALAGRLAGNHRVLSTIFAIVVVFTGGYVIWRAAGVL